MSLATNHNIITYYCIIRNIGICPKGTVIPNNKSFSISEMCFSIDCINLSAFFCYLFYTNDSNFITNLSNNR